MKSFLRCAAMVVLAVAAVWAQRSDAKTMAVRGEIVSSNANVGSLSVELCADGSGMSETVAVNLDGSFEFHSGSPRHARTARHRRQRRRHSPGVRLHHQPQPDAFHPFARWRFPQCIPCKGKHGFAPTTPAQSTRVQPRRPTRRANRPPPKATWRRLAPTSRRLSPSTRSSPMPITTWAPPRLA